MFILEKPKGHGKVVFWQTDNADGTPNFLYSKIGLVRFPDLNSSVRRGLLDGFPISRIMSMETCEMWTSNLDN